MAESLKALTEKEKETLRLIVRGHDANSMANHLGLSVHTINERLLLARRKMAVSSSREAARLLLDQESDTPQSFADKDLRGAEPVPDEQRFAPPEDHRAVRRPLAWIIGGTIAMSLILAALLLSGGEQANQANPAPAPQSAGTPAQAAVVETAQRWLSLVDAGDWDASWRTTAQAFRDLNTLEAWTAASEQGRVPLGEVRSRSILSYDSVPAPPHGYQIVRFRTSFAHRSDAVETLSLSREGDEWKVAGITIE